MPSPIKLRTDYSPAQLRTLAKSAKTNSQGRRLLSLAAVLDGMNRTDAARIGGMDRQTLQDWVHRFNQLGARRIARRARRGRRAASVRRSKGRTVGDC